MLDPVTVYSGPGFGFDCHFNSLKTICNYDEQKENKVFKQKGFFFLFVFKVW